MISGAARTDGRKSIGDILLGQVASDGSASHPYATAPALHRGVQGTRNLTDAVHHFCILHGRHPGVFDLALEHCSPGQARDWIEAAREGFSFERSFLTRLAVAGGPLPSTPGQAETESALFGQRNALETLARSERFGCAVGAAIGLAIDWRAIRTVLEIAADRFGIASDPPRLPPPAAAGRAADAIANSPAVERALGFGAQQLLLQHRGLWSLLEAREAARRA
jgi:hypothetical protein